MTNALRHLSGPLTLTPAYGKVYANEADMLVGWNIGKDFRMPNGQCCSIRDIEDLKNDCSSLWLAQHARRTGQAINIYLG
jgi:hypothetical protein